MMLGPMMIKRIDATKPVPNPHTAPRVVNRFQNKDRTITGKFAEAATAKASATRKATLAFGPSRIAIAMATAPTTNARNAYFFSGLALAAAVDHVCIKIMRERGRSTNSQTRNHREDGGKSNCRNEREEEIAAQRLCQQRGAS